MKQAFQTMASRPQGGFVSSCLIGLGVSAVVALSCSTALAEEKPGASFVEEFDQVSEQRWYISDGWVNGDHQNCTWSRGQIEVVDGILRIGFAEQVNKLRAYACGEIQTKGVYAYGTYEVVLRTPRGSGLNANMFTFIGPVHKSPHDEIDFEFLLKDTSRVQLNSYVSGVGGNEVFAPLETKSDAAFSSYGLIWEPQRIRWFINGALVHEQRDTAKIPSHPSKIYMSLWGSDTLGDWMGAFRDPGEKLALEVDRIAFTARGEPCQFAASLACDATLFAPGSTPPAAKKARP